MKYGPPACSVKKKSSPHFRMMKKVALILASVLAIATCTPMPYSYSSGYGLGGPLALGGYSLSSIGGGYPSGLMSGGYSLGLIGGGALGYGGLMPGAGYSYGSLGGGLIGMPYGGLLGRRQGLGLGLRFRLRSRIFRYPQYLGSYPYGYSKGYGYRSYLPGLGGKYY